MIPPLKKTGRVIVPDLIGFGLSDRPAAPNAYSYRSHARWVRVFIQTLGLERITLVCQDWGGLLGLRVLSQMPERFVRLVAMNTGIPDGRGFSKAFLEWRRMSQRVRALDVPMLLRNTLKRRVLSEAEEAAYAAPFPSREYQTAALVFPRLVPIRPDHPGAYENRIAIEKLRSLDLPVLLPWADGDPITGPAEAQLRSIFKNVAPPPDNRECGPFFAGGRRRGDRRTHRRVDPRVNHFRLVAAKSQDALAPRTRPRSAPRHRSAPRCPTMVPYAARRGAL